MRSPRSGCWLWCAGKLCQGKSFFRFGLPDPLSSFELVSPWTRDRKWDLKARPQTTAWEPPTNRLDNPDRICWSPDSLSYKCPADANFTFSKSAIHTRYSPDCVAYRRYCSNECKQWNRAAAVKSLWRHTFSIKLLSHKACRQSQACVHSARPIRERPPITGLWRSASVRCSWSSGAPKELGAQR